jgi:hypothetical protein
MTPDIFGGTARDNLNRHFMDSYDWSKKGDRIRGDRAGLISVGVEKREGAECEKLDCKSMCVAVDLAEYRNEGHSRQNNKPGLKSVMQIIHWVGLDDPERLPGIAANRFPIRSYEHITKQGFHEDWVYGVYGMLSIYDRETNDFICVKVFDIIPPRKSEG